MVSIPTSLGFGDKLPTLSSLPSMPSFSSQLGNPPPYPNVNASFLENAMAGPSGQQPENQVTSSNTSNPATPDQQEKQLSQGSEGSTAPPQNDFSITMWLNNLGLSAYVDNFHQLGLYSMFDLQEFSLEDIQKMKIGTQHRNKIWRSLVEFRNSASYTTTAPTEQSQAAQQASSQASTASLSSQNSGYCPGFYEVTKYTFKHTISLDGAKKEDHDYC